MYKIKLIINLKTVSFMYQLRESRSSAETSAAACQIALKLICERPAPGLRDDSRKKEIFVILKKQKNKKNKGEKENEKS